MTPRESDPDTGSVIAEADRLHRELDAATALSMLRSALRDSREPELLWRAARESVHLGILDEDAGREDAARRWYASAEGWARRLIEADSADARGWSWLAVSLGRRSDLEGTMDRVSMANEIKRSAEAALERDPDQSGALHVLGAWHAEILRLNAVERFTARRILGGSTFDQAEWERAEALLRRAVETAPGELVHRIDYARVLDDLDRRDEARAQLRTAIELDPIHPADPVFLEEARELLLRWGG